MERQERQRLGVRVGGSGGRRRKTGSEKDKTLKTNSGLVSHQASLPLPLSFFFFFPEMMHIPASNHIGRQSHCLAELTDPVKSRHTVLAQSS